MAGILAIMTLMAVLFGALHLGGAHPVLYMFFGLLAIVICLVQMRYGDVPRVASIAAGAIFFPICVIVTISVFDRHGVFWELVLWSPLMAVLGAFFGYLAGACTAGVFLLMDLAEPYLPGSTAKPMAHVPSVAEKQATEVVIATMAEATRAEPPIMAELVTTDTTRDEPPPPPQPIRDET